MADGPSSSPCLVEVQVLLDGARLGFLDGLVASQRIAVAEGVRLAALRWRASLDARAGRSLDRAVCHGAPIISATPDELAAVWRCDGIVGLASGEAESLALVVGRGLSLCTEEPLLWTIMKQLGVLERLVALPDLLKGLPSARD